MARVFRVQQVLGDGSIAAGRTFLFYPDVDQATGKPFLGEDGQPAIVLELQAVTKEQYREIVKRHTTPVANGTGAMLEHVDYQKVNEDVVALAIVRWRGFVGADDKPLVCIDVTKRALDTALQNAVRNQAMFAQPAEVAAASFREPADVSAVVG